MFGIRDPPLSKNKSITERGGNTMKNDYKRNDFYIRKDSEGNKSYFMKIKGKYFEVSHDVFNVCFASYRKQLRDIKKDYDNRLISLDQELEDGSKIIDMIADAKDEFRFIRLNDEVKCILDIIENLSEEEKTLITNLLLKEKTEKELAKQLHVSQVTVHKRKNNILKKLRKK